jgi:metallophosphoesterase (TIGR00282 family)
MKILAAGDVFGTYGCDYLSKVLPGIKKENNIDLCIVNGENSAPYNGITKQSAEQIFDAGADVITTGNHVFGHRESFDYIEETQMLIRPENYGDSAPGHGYCTVDLGRCRALVMNISGLVFMEGLNDPFRTADRIIDENKDIKIKVLDFHAEATSEKKAMGYYLDGRVSCVFGTHTHVQTADERVLEKGTAYITDTGMTGVENSVIGMDTDACIKRFTTHVPDKFRAAEGECVFNGCIFDIDEKTGLARSCRRIVKGGSNINE